MAIEGAVGCVKVALKAMAPKLNYLKEFWRRYLIVEPILILFWAPSILSLDYLPINNECRFNLSYDAFTCFYMAGETFWPNFHFDVCKDEADPLMNNVYLYSSRIAFVIPYIILMFAGGWADRYNRRKAFLIIPIVGRCLYYKNQLIFSVFFDSLPLKYSCYSSMLPALFGDSPCFMMSVFSYITTTTPESDRFLRFSILAVFVLLTNYLSVIIEPINYFGYTITCAICVLIQIAGILYVIYLVKEPKTNESVSQLNDSAADTDLTNLDDLPIKENVTNVKLSLKPPRRNVLKEFFDSSLLLEFIKLPFKKRGNNGRLILLLLILCYYLTVGTIYIESKYYYDHSHNTYRMKKLVTSIIGACLCGVIFSKMWKFSDSMIGIWIAVFTAVSRGMFVIADTKTISKEFYTAEVLDLFSILRIIPIKCIASSISEGDGKLFSFFGILEPIVVFIYPRIFVPVLSAVIDSFENLMLLFIELFYLPNVLILFACYFLIRRHSANLA